MRESVDHEGDYVVNALPTEAALLRNYIGGDPDNYLKGKKVLR